MTDTPQPGPAPDSPPVAETFQQKLTRWFQVKEDLAALKVQEHELRMQLFNNAFPKPKEKGTQRYGIGHGKDLKATTSLNYSIDKDAMARLGNHIPNEIKDRVFKYTPEVVDAQLRAVLDDSNTPPDVRRALAECVISKPGTPKLEIVDTSTRA